MRGRGMKRCRAEGAERFALFVAAAVLANNLMVIGELLTKRSRRRRKRTDNFSAYRRSTLLNHADGKLPRPRPPQGALRRFSRGGHGSPWLPDAATGRAYHTFA
jgi:hypothetical protein